jgi:starch synthase
MTSSLKVLFLASEAAPFIKIGGLGDVAGSLPIALNDLPAERPDSKQLDIRMALPLHHLINRENYALRPVSSFNISSKNGLIPGEVYETTIEGIKVYLVDGPIMPKDGPIYHNDAGLDGPKFTFFSLAALELARQMNWQPDVLHAHDWHTSPAVYSLSLVRPHEPFFQETASLLTLHNLPYLGIGASQALSNFGLPPAYDSPLPDWANHLPLPLGLLTADHINAVSPGYAQEILTHEFGSGLQDFLRTRSSSISGILNGIDLDQWNPEQDKHLIASYSLEDISPRKQNKIALLEEFDLIPDPSGRTALLAMINRMDHQKGVDLVPDALRLISDQPWQAVILGTGDPEVEVAAKRLEDEFPDRIRVAIRFDGALARRMYSGADALLIPSRYEPCGLTQMIAMRYGCVPIARSTGGLRDTISDYHHSEFSTGFLFRDPTPEALAEAIRRTLEVYADQRRWRYLQLRGMKQDFSWEKSAQQYYSLYLSLIKRKTA